MRRKLYRLLSDYCFPESLPTTPTNLATIKRHLDRSQGRAGGENTEGTGTRKEFPQTVWRHESRGSYGQHGEYYYFSTIRIKYLIM